MSNEQDQDQMTTNPLADQLPQNFGELYQLLAARLDAAFMTTENNARERYVDLRTRIEQGLEKVEIRLEKVEIGLEKLARQMSDVDRRLDAHIRDLIHTKDRVRELEDQQQPKH